MPGLGGFLSPSGSDTATHNILTRTALAAIIGGTASAVGGGKFANGAYTAAMQHLFNEETKKTIRSLSGITRKGVKISVLIDRTEGKNGLGINASAGKLGLDGHAGMAIGAEFYDYGPENGVDWRTGFRDRGASYWDRYADTTDGDSNYVQVQNYVAGKGVNVYEFYVSPSSAIQMNEYWENLYSNFGTYTLTGQQCTTTCIRALQQGGVGVSYGLSPNSLARQLEGVNGVKKYILP